MKNRRISYNSVLLVILGIAVCALGVLGYFYWTEREEAERLSAALETAHAELSSLSEERRVLEERLTYVTEEFESEKKKNELFAEQIGDIQNTVGTLDKLSKTDEELLQKYSKVYFLNEHYIPSELSEIDPSYLLQPERDQYIHKNVWPFLEEMLEDAEDDGIDLKIISAYRSFETQNDLKAAYTVTYGSGANRFSADQGYSEHQLGTAIDVTTPEIGGTHLSFENNDGYQWLTENAYKYGFVLSYPKDNAYYIFEPWHWRFVGESLARRLRNDETSFYDLDQREIDEYLISIFD